MEFLSDFSRKYATTAWVRGEMFSPYLGLVAIGALVWMTVEFILRMLNLRKVPRRFSLHVPQCLWVILYAAIGGGNCLLGLFGLQYFRGSNRYSIWISAICLLFLVSRMSRIVRRWNKAASYALAMGVAALGLLDQLPLPPSKAETQALAKQVENDRAFCRKLEEKLPPER